MYKHTLTVKDEMLLQTNNLLSVVEPKVKKITVGKNIRHNEIADLKGYFSKDELEAIRKEEEYLQSGPGKIERILNEEMERLQNHMETKIQQQDEEFLNKMGVKK